MEKYSSLEDGLKSFFPPIITSWIHWPEATRAWKLPLLGYLWTFITPVSCFLHWPSYPFNCPLFIISRAKWLTPCLSFITAAPEISGHSARRNSHPKARWSWGISRGSFVWLLPLLLSARLQCGSLINRGQWRVSSLQVWLRIDW